MAESMRTQFAFKEERIVADYSEIEAKDHTRSGTTELRRKIKYSVRERITQIESTSLSPQDLGKFEAYLQSITDKISDGVSGEVTLNARYDLSRENICSITPPPSNGVNPDSKYTIKLNSLANDPNKTLEIQLCPGSAAGETTLKGIKVITLSRNNCVYLF